MNKVGSSEVKNKPSPNETPNISLRAYDLVINRRHFEIWSNKGR